jgi:hypothetical protein
LVVSLVALTQANGQRALAIESAPLFVMWRGLETTAYQEETPLLFLNLPEHAGHQLQELTRIMGLNEGEVITHALAQLCDIKTGKVVVVTAERHGRKGETQGLGIGALAV